MPAVGIILGSDSDLPKIRQCPETLEKLGVDFEIIFSSAHRTPKQTVEWVESAQSRGIKVIIAAAGGAAHLPGVCAGHTVLPVIGIPIESNLSGGLDSLLSIAQMPSGIPVGTMCTGKAAGNNAALFAAQILATADTELSARLANHRKAMKDDIEQKNQTLAKIGFKAYIEKSGESK